MYYCLRLIVIFRTLAKLGVPKSDSRYRDYSSSSEEEDLLISKP